MSPDSNLNVREVACGSRRESEPPRPQRESRGVAHGGGVREARRDEVAAGSRCGSWGGGWPWKNNFRFGARDSKDDAEGESSQLGF